MWPSSVKFISCISLKNLANEIFKKICSKDEISCRISKPTFVSKGSYNIKQSQQIHSLSLSVSLSKNSSRHKCKLSNLKWFKVCSFISSDTVVKMVENYFLIIKIPPTPIFTRRRYCLLFDVNAVAVLENMCLVGEMYGHTKWSFNTIETKYTVLHELQHTPNITLWLLKEHPWY